MLDWQILHKKSKHTAVEDLVIKDSVQVLTEH